MRDASPAFFKPNSQKLKLGFFSILYFVLIFSDFHLHYSDYLRTAIIETLRPLQNLAAMPHRIGRGISFFFIKQSDLIKENRELKEANLLGLANLQDHQAIVAENQKLRNLLRLRKLEHTSALVAEIIYGATDPFLRQVVIDKGRLDGVHEGAPVVDVDGLIGQVHRVYSSTSDVILISDHNQIVPVQVLRNGIRAVIFGLGFDHELEIRFMPLATDIVSGDVLITSGLDGNYPYGVPVGTVSSVVREESFPFASVKIMPVAKVNAFRQVVVLSQLEIGTSTKPEQIKKSIKGESIE